MSQFLQLQDPWNWFALDVTIKATVVLLLAAGLTATVRSASAAWRHRIWSLAIASIVVLPLVQLATPGLLRPVVPQQWLRPPVQSPRLGPTGDIARTESIGNLAPGQTRRVPERDPPAGNLAATQRSLVQPTGQERRLAESEPLGFLTAVVPAAPTVAGQPVKWLFVIWCAGAVMALSPLVIGLVWNERLRRRCRPAPDALSERVAALSRRVGLRRVPTLFLGDDGQMPMTFGMSRSYVVLPAGAPQWSRERFDSVVLHELAHIGRFDVPVQLVARFACGIYWFHPLAWWAIRKMRFDRELACDDCVLTAGQEPSDYATELLDIAREHRTAAPYMCAALSMARRSQLEGRLLAVLDKDRHRAPVGSVRAVMLLVLTVGVVFGIGSVRPVLEAGAVEQLADTSPGAAASDSERCLVSGIVLTPDDKPAAGARIEVIAHDNIGRWDRRSRDDSSIDRFEARADAAGRFQIELPRSVSRPRRRVALIASALDVFPAVESVDTRKRHVAVTLQLRATKKVRVQLVDPVGNPIPDVLPHFRVLVLDGKKYISAPHPDGNAVTKVWPTFSRSDQDGYATANLPIATNEFSLIVKDDRVGAHFVSVKVGDAPVSVVLDPRPFLTGEVVDPDGTPVADAELVLTERPYRVVRTDADGTFRAVKGTTNSLKFLGPQCMIHVYPPAGTDLLFQSIEWEWPNEGIGDARLTIEMERGIMIEGQVIESGSGKPIEGAQLVFEPQIKNNPLYKESYRSRSIGADMRYATDADGRFQMPVIAGPGYLLVSARSLDYLPVETSMGQMWYGEPGLQRRYYDGVKRLELESGSSPDPITIELTPGKTLHREVVRPDGSPAEANAYSPSYLQTKYYINAMVPAIPVSNGQLDVPGFDPERSTPLFILDIKAECGAVVSSAAGHVDPNEATIKLLPTGAAKFQFVNDRGEPLVDHKPGIRLIFKEGSPATHFITPDQPLWSDTIIWDNVIRPKKVPTTDAGGHVVVDGLIPGADYNLGYVNKEGDWDEGYQFTILAGETTDVGEVVLYQQD